MKIQNNNNQIYKNPNFSGFLDNKKVLKGLEYIADHSATFIAGTELAGALLLRPVSISLTPKTKQENKKWAISKSVASGVINFALVKTFATPIENAIKNISAQPEKFLSKKSIKNLKGNAKNLAESNNFKFLAHSFKIGTNILASFPKTLLTVGLMTIVADKILNKKQENKASNTPNFKGKLTDTLSKKIGKIFDKKGLQDFSKKVSNKNFDDLLLYAKDTLLTTLFSIETLKNKKIEKENKKPLIINSVVSTGLAIISSMTIEKVFDKQIQKSLDNFKQKHLNDVKLHKYVEGLNLARSAFILAAIYYGIIPIISTFAGEKLSKEK